MSQHHVNPVKVWRMWAMSRSLMGRCCSSQKSKEDRKKVPSGARGNRNHVILVLNTQTVREREGGRGSYKASTRTVGTVRATHLYVFA
ncbi:uncharacterized protein CIMG_10771 [Coccidioides immitis RS]|uniref:Uncharacterized protein n=2 Tax=Coccidioides immitis TaxID=5501 RepID=A0A0D8JSQ5_COCIM|nr:uncharacterized protein CIMG_10771 [Coccidioides immitis RS]KJF60144.1 hypothetical protein CIMG_10771 [Coccidioides immitis RS]KMP01519.1 hypothetical protein CIRG_01657 [Coccidioides immitis RMSCC 2394]